MDGWLLPHHMREEKNFHNQKFMLEHLISLLDDANDFSRMWPKPAMLGSYVRWSKGKVVVIMRLIKLIGLGGAQRHTAPSEYNVHSLANNKKYGKQIYQVHAMLIFQSRLLWAPNVSQH